MKIGVLAVVAAMATTVAVTALSPGSASAATVWQVSPGQSIQAAIDGAAPGDTIVVGAGTFYESVLIEKANITVRGAGSDTGGTLLLPPAVFPANNCGERSAGICFRGEVHGTDGPTAYPTSFLVGGAVSGIRFDGFVVGVSLSATDGTRVHDIVALDNGMYGITDTVSKNSVLDHNVVAGAGHSGIYLGNYNVPHANATVTGNDISDAFYGVSTYDSQGAVVTGNYLHGSCAGYMGFVDSLGVAGGDYLTIKNNLVNANNELCRGVPSINFPQVQGSGIVLVGSAHTTVSQNVVTGNIGTYPLSGGIVVVTGRTYDAAVAADEGSVTVSSNVAFNNGTANLLWDRLGTGVTFAGNICTTSSPSGLC